MNIEQVNNKIYIEISFFYIEKKKYACKKVFVDIDEIDDKIGTLTVDNQEVEVMIPDEQYRRIQLLKIFPPLNLN